MRIALFFSTSGHSGVDRTAQLLIPEFCKRGHHVDLLKVRKHGPDIPPMENLNTIDLGTAHTMSALGAVKRYLKEVAPDVLLADKDRCNRVALFAKMLSKSETRVVVSSGTIMSENLKNRSWLEGVFHRLSFNYLYPKAHAIITPSKDAATDLAAISQLSEEQITVVPLPIIAGNLEEMASEPVSHRFFDTKQTDPYGNKTTENKIPVIISIGELTERKDQTTQLKAMAHLLEEQVCRLLILGKGKDEDKLKALCKELDIEEQVSFLGYQENPYNYLNKADVFIHTATFEGFGMVMVEALALGKPVVAADCLGGPAEILQQGKLGVLVPVHDARALALGIKKALQALLETTSDASDSIDSSMKNERIAGVKPYTLPMSANAYLACMSKEHIT